MFKTFSCSRLKQLLLPRKKEEKKRRKRKKNDEKQQSNKENSSKVNKKFKQKKSNDDANKQKRKYVRKQKKPQIVTIKAEDDDDDDDDEDEACSARPCKHPSSEEVDWVQCDTCELWYHNLCVAITAKAAAELDSYICPYCSVNGEYLSNTASPDSNVDVVSTTPHATTPPSPRSPNSTGRQLLGSVGTNGQQPSKCVTFPTITLSAQTTNSDTIVLSDGS